MSTLSAPPTLDVRRGSCATNLPRLLELFDALAPRESLLLLSDHAPKGALQHLQRERPGAFEWSPLELGPEAWRVEIARRPAAGPRAVDEALAWDHDRLDELERQAFAARAAGELARARALYGIFTCGLRRHIGFEEQLLFPEFEARAGLRGDAGPTGVMRLEHRGIEKLIGDIERSIDDARAPVEAWRAELHELLGGHNDKEEQVLYPMTDQLLGPDERDALVRRIQAFGL